MCTRLQTASAPRPSTSDSDPPPSPSQQVPPTDPPQLHHSICSIGGLDCMAMAPPNDSEPCTQRLPAEDELQPPPAASCGAASDDHRATAAGTSSEPDHQAAPPAVVPAEAEAEKKSSAAAAGSGGGGELVARRPAAGAEESARERLKRHRTEMAGRVRIPEMWGQERLLKDWVDCAVFDRPLAATTGLLTARDALVAECATARRPGPAVSHGSTGRPLRVHNGCS